MSEKTQRIPNIIENKFWQFVIDLLDSDDETIALLVNFGYQISQKFPGKKFFYQALFWIGMGTFLGVAIGIMLI